MLQILCLTNSFTIPEKHKLTNIFGTETTALIPVNVG